MSVFKLAKDLIPGDIILNVNTRVPPCIILQTTIDFCPGFIKLVFLRNNVVLTSLVEYPDEEYPYECLETTI